MSGGHFLPTPHPLRRFWHLCLLKYGELDSTSAVCALVPRVSIRPSRESVFGTGPIFAKFSALLDMRTCMCVINMIFFFR